MLNLIKKNDSLIDTSMSNLNNSIFNDLLFNELDLFLNPHSIFKNKYNDHFMNLDAYVDNDVFYINVDIPGVKKQDIDISIVNDNLIIKYENNENIESHDSNNKKFFIKERKVLSKKRIVKIPEGYDKDNINASYSDGVLSLTIPINKNLIKNKIKIN